MATADKFITTEKVVKEVRVEKVRLTLSVAEARTLLAIASKVSGSSKDSSHYNPSPRIHMDSISKAISDTMDVYYGDTPEFQHMTGYINFESYQDHESEYWQ